MDSFSVVFTRKGAEWPTVKGRFDKMEELRKSNVVNIVIMLPGFPTVGEGPISCRMDLTQGDSLRQSITIDDFTIVIERV